MTRWIELNCVLVSFQEREKVRVTEFKKQAHWAVQVIARFFILIKVSVAHTRVGLIR